MRLSGVDPGIIRELSGIYKPFVKAFKELISNAYDADAQTIDVTVAKDFSAIEVRDDGHGMTPFHFHQDFARLGGSTAWLRGGRSPGGRARIGYKGIGFLAVARYCRTLRVRTCADRKFRSERTVTLSKGRVALNDLVPPVLPMQQVRPHLRVVGVRFGRQNMKPRDWKVEDGQLYVPRRRGGAVDVTFEIDCSDMELTAELDFDYLLGLERRADLGELDDFCAIKVGPRRSATPFTSVTLLGLKEFVVRELSAPAAKGKAKNVVNKSGRDQFIWRLRRSSPITDEFGPRPGPIVGRLARVQAEANLPTLRVKWRDEPLEPVLRPVYLPKAGRVSLEESVLPIDINEGGLRAVGYLLARNEVIYPAELRGVTIRVRNVAIGDASFLGWEDLISGPRKAALSQITGEIMVLDGLDASDAINPGRESFYDENHHYRLLRRMLVGSEESIGGLAARAIREILDRIAIRSLVTKELLEAKQRRGVLDDVASAVNYYGSAHLPTGQAVTDFFSSRVRANGLSHAKDVPLRPSARVSGFDIEGVRGLSKEYDIDFKSKKVLLDFERDVWSTVVYLAGDYYDVRLKQGKPEQSICEFDHVAKRIYVNWGHPVRQQMDNASFLRSAILLRFAHHVARSDADSMLDLALNMLAFRVE
jgi:Histidine kinase-, DNA gyrase B-, and HSP90-like ATPase